MTNNCSSLHLVLRYKILYLLTPLPPFAPHGLRCYSCIPGTFPPSPNMLDPKCPPPPYTLLPASSDDSAKSKQPSVLQSGQRNDTEVQQQEKTSNGSKGSTSIWRRAVRRTALGGLRHPMTAASAATAAIANDGQPRVSGPLPLPRWVGHNGMTCGHGAGWTRRPSPPAPLPRVNRYSFDILFCPPPQPFASEGARWQEARICFGSNDFSKLQGSIPWRANLDDCCNKDTISIVNYPFPVPFFFDGSSGKIKAYSYTPWNGTSVGGYTFERTIKLSLLHERTDWAHWSFTLALTSRDGAWLASLSRADVAAVTGLDSAIR